MNAPAAQQDIAKKNGEAAKGHPSQDEIHQLALRDVFVPHAWNGRNAGPDPAHPVYAQYTPATNGQLVATGTSLSDDEGARAPWSTAFAGLVEAILQDGQDTPVTVRPTPHEFKKESGGKPYTLTEGFRRFEALRLLSERRASLKNVKEGCIRATIVAETEAEALLRNGRENLDRENIPAPDVCFLIRRMVKSGMSGVDIARSTTRAESYVHVLKVIGEKCSDKILNAWRNCTTLDGKPFARRHLGIDVMERIAVASTPAEQEEAFTKACEGVIAKPKPASKANAWLESGKAKAEKIGIALAGLVYFGVVDVNKTNLHKLEKVIPDMVVLNPPNLKNKNEDAKRESKISAGNEKIVKAAVDGFHKELARLKEEEESAAEEEMEEETAKGKGN